MTNAEIRITLGTIGIAAIAGSYIYTEKNRTALKEAEAYRDAQAAKLKQAEVDSQMPAEYWAAKEAEMRASVEKHRLELEHSYKLEIDRRDRTYAEREAQRAFEKDAPDGYWAAKKAEEEEKTRRHQMDLDAQRRKDQAEADRVMAKRQAEALENSARILERAVNRNTASF